VPKHRRRFYGFLLAMLIIVALVAAVIFANQDRSAQAPSSTPSPASLSSCGPVQLDEITLIYRDGRPSEDRQVATFFPWGCPTKQANCKFTGEHDAYPDPACTPGAIYDLTPNRDPARYSEAANQQLICATKANASVGNKDRRNVSKAAEDRTWQRYDRTKPTGERYETDHFIPISIGGSNREANLLPQTESASRDRDEKDRVESSLSVALCKHRADGSYLIGLSQAQTLMRFHWTELYDQIQRYGHIIV
jgi:hypothetical protein